MLNGPELGKALERAMARKGVKNADLAARYKVKGPSVVGWKKTGRISKATLFDLMDYFSDVASPEDWGIKTTQNTPHRQQGLMVREPHSEYNALGETAKNSIDSIVRSVGGSDVGIAEVAEFVATSSSKPRGEKLLRKDDPAVRHEMSAQQKRLVRVVKMLAGRLTNDEAASFAQLIEAAAGRRPPE